ncbi:MAG: hypothetical protein JXC32_13975 [Anaerolineae bacterium]|nr:hypothetical protein [Anaerolineae bacterium]
MSKLKLPMIALLVVQVVAVLLYPPAYFQRAPQAAVMPPALLILFVLALVGINTGTLSLESGRSLLIFVQGINIVVRVMTLFPNLRTPGGDWAWGLLVAQIIGTALSWYTMLAMEHQSLQALKLRQTQVGHG